MPPTDSQRPRPVRRRSSLRLLLPALLLLAFLPGFAAFAYHVAHRLAEERAAALAQLSETVSDVAADNGRLLGETLYLLKALAITPAVRNFTADPAACGAVMARVVAENPRYAFAGVVAADGSVVCSGLPVRPGVHVRDRTWFARVMASREFSVGDLAVGKGSGRASVHLAYPLLEDGRFLGAINVALDVEWLNRHLSKLDLPHDTVVSVVDSRGTVVGRHPGGARFIGTVIPQDHLVRRMAAEDSGTFEAEALDGRERLFAFAKLGRQSTGTLTVVLGQDEETVVRPAEKDLRFGGLGLGLVALLGLGAAAVSGHQLIGRPSARLVEAARRLGSGDMRARVGALDAGAELATVAQAFDDMADRLARHESDLRRARDAAEAASVSKSRFLAAASHDLRQPLQSLFLSAEVLNLRNADGSLAPALRHMNDSLEAMKEILDKLLDISKLEAGMLPITRAPVGADTVLERLAAGYGPRFAAQGLRLRSVPCAAEIETDRILLERILGNFLDNALRYTRSGGAVVGCRRRGPVLRFDIVDSGIGIPEGQQELVFEEFVQLHNAERDRAKGLGLGLAIAQRIAGALGHPIELTSRPGRGSRFSVTVPLARADRRLHEVGAGEAQPKS